MRVTLDSVREQLELADQLLVGRDSMFEPQDLPGRYGCVVKALDHLLQVIDAEAVLSGGWAVWRHGYIGRVTQDIDIVLADDRIEDFLRSAAVAGFEAPSRGPGRWPQLLHKETGIRVDILPEGGRPGTVSKPAPTTLPHPSALGAHRPQLRYISLPALIELKIAAGRARDESDVIELINANSDQIDTIRRHLASVHVDYVKTFDDLVQRAREQQDD